MDNFALYLRVLSISISLSEYLIYPSTPSTDTLSVLIGANEIRMLQFPIVRSVNISVIVFPLSTLIFSSELSELISP